MKKVSIIIPTFNRAYLLRDTLDSILNQTYSHWECLIIDDGSTDNTRELIKEYSLLDSRIFYHHRPFYKPKGANSCRNYGFALSKGDYVNWFDSDDVMHPEKLELQVNQLEKENKNLVVCQTIIFNNNIDNNLGLRHEKIISDDFWEDYIKFKILFLTQSPLWRKKFLEKFDKLFDENLHAAQEWEFHVRALSQLKEYATINKPLVYLRIHNFSVSKSNRQFVLWHYYLARLKVYQKFKYKLSEETRLFLVRYLITKYKEALRGNHYRLASKIWLNYILRTKNISIKSKFQLTIAFPVFFMSKKGNVFISHINE